ncbi:MAG: NUDIX hydrolase [Candidatus Nealsonbacteria bacterium]|nr:NUDIX hydrolase [Candidatus Nealsonbacteria bacterium]
MKKDYGIYHVGFKILLKKENKFLFLRSANKKYWDLPGGRADNTEYKKPVLKILEREVREELGNKIRYKIGDMAFQSRRYFPKRKTYTLSTVYEAKYLSGEILISPEHSGYEWINPKTYKFKEKGFFCKEEYLAFKEYFKFK